MKGKAINIVTVLLFVLSLAMIIAGIHFDEPSIVLRKAVNVCMECVGIG